MARCVRTCGTAMGWLSMWALSRWSHSPAESPRPRAAWAWAISSDHAWRSLSLFAVGRVALCVLCIALPPSPLCPRRVRRDPAEHVQAGCPADDGAQLGHGDT